MKTILAPWLVLSLITAVGCADGEDGGTEQSSVDSVALTTPHDAVTTSSPTDTPATDGTLFYYPPGATACTSAQYDVAVQHCQQNHPASIVDDCYYNPSSGYVVYTYVWFGVHA